MISRDQVAESFGRLRVRYGDMQGVLVRYEPMPDLCTVKLEGSAGERIIVPRMVLEPA